MSNHTYCDTHHEWLFDGENCKFCVVVKATEERIIKLLEEHQMNGETAGGFLGGCTCGEFIDDYSEHLMELIKGEQK